MPDVAIGPGTVVDVAGTGAITPGQTAVISGGVPILMVGDVVAEHTAGGTTHPANTITLGSTSVFIGVLGIAYNGSTAACGGPVSTTFNPTVQIGI